jgi:hypothetical protein
LKRFQIQNSIRQICLLAILSNATHLCSAQVGDIQKVISNLAAGAVPGDLLSTKTMVLYDPAFTTKELEQVQAGFERTGIDAVLYFPVDVPMCNRDVQKVFTDHLTKREIKYLALLQKRPTELEFVFTEFSKTKDLMVAGQAAWKITGKNIQEISMDIYRTALNSQKRLNMLVSPTPEYDLKFDFIRGTRGEYFALDLKVDKLAILKFGNAQMDKALEEIFKNNYPFNYEFFESGTEDKEIRQKGFLLLLSAIHTRGYPAMELLKYNMTNAGSAIASVSYPNGQLQLKTIPANELVYKFYFKQLENGNIYLGTKWDADPSWEQALLNQIMGLKAEMRIK